MIFLALITATLAFLLLAFQNRPYQAWVSAFGILLLFWLVGGAALGLWIVAAVLYGAAVVVFGIRAFREPLISRPAMGLMGPMMPRISETERLALEAGTVWWDGELFTGDPDWNKLLDFQVRDLSQEERDFLSGPVEELCAMADDHAIHRRGDLPPEVWDFIRREKFMGMIIPKEYGGLGFSAAAHSAVITKLSSRSVTVSVTVMVPNSLGPAELLDHYGTEEQKRHYLPRLADGREIPAFALTEPLAGSDAAAGLSTGVVERGVFQGQEVLGIRLNWDKRYITLGPIATVLGLAFKLKDPDNLLSDNPDPGITCALIPTDLPGVDAHLRHDPLGVPFLNGPTFGKDVFVPVDFIIGGSAMAGQGWRMLMESLAAGRSISLPALAVGAAQGTLRATGAYATLREQFGMSVGKFEGIQAPLAEITGKAYLMQAARTLVAGAVDSGERPSVISAMTKAYMTEFMRNTVNHGMDVMAGAGISRGPRNILAHAYQSLPVGITVEGANILTRSLIIYGQGAIRCHPFIQKEIAAVQQRDVRAFDDALWKHVGLVFTNIARSTILALTGGRADGAPAAGALSPWFGRMARWSASFTLLSDFLMGLLGADVKRKERISGRMADAFTWIYLGSAVLKRYYDEGQKAEHAMYAQWALQTAEWNIQEALHGVLLNLPNRFWALKLRAWIFPLGRRAKPPSDDLESQIARSILDGRPGREELTGDIYIPGENDPALGRLEQALAKVVASAPAEAKIRAAVKAGRMPRLPRLEAAEAAYKAGILTQEEARSIRDAQAARDDAIQVDSFEPDDLLGPEAAEDFKKDDFMKPGIDSDVLRSVSTATVTQTDTLSDLCRHLREAGVIALDMEFASESVYFPRLHLIQVASKERAALIDPLADIDLSPLWSLIADPEVIKVTHAGRQDGEISYQQGGKVPKAWHDTQVAAALLGMGEQIGYANLLQRMSGVKLKKTERVTDWSRRPLSQPQEAYAYNDVLYLLDIYDRLVADLKERNRFAWFLEELSYYEDEATYVKVPEEMWRRVSGKQSLGRQGLAILRELAAWRELEARERDRPRGRIVSDDVLVELAKRRPESLKDMKPMRRIHPRVLERFGESMVQAVARGLDCPQDSWPKPLKGLPEDPSLQLSGYLMDALLRLRARENEIAPSYLANQRELRRLADYLAGRLDNGDTPPLLKGWRKDLVGDDLVRLFEGKLKLAIDPESHHPTVEKA